jgi:hypothetical protein
MLLFINFLNKTAASIPTIREDPSAGNIEMRFVLEELSDINLKKLRAPAADMRGIPDKKENSSAFFFGKPAKIPKIVVTPDLEVPGINANACPKPTNNALLIGRFENFSNFGLIST